MSLGNISRGALEVIHEAARHFIRRPTMVVAAAAHTDHDRWLLVRSVGSDRWSLPGTALRWGETLRSATARCLTEAAGPIANEIVRVVGVDSRFAADTPRAHLVTVLLECGVGENLDARAVSARHEARLFARADLPRLAHRARKMLDATLGSADAFLE
jgi:ADP-ribose pyrophosphatase YjhB (NUDIX family)